MYRTEAPISEVFAVQSLNSVKFPLAKKKSWLTPSFRHRHCCRAPNENVEGVGKLSN